MTSRSSLLPPYRANLVLWFALILAFGVSQKDANASLNLGLRSATTPMVVGQTVTWVADSWQANLDPLQYRFSVTAEDGMVVAVRSYGPSNTLNWLPYEPGTYTLSSSVRDRQTGEMQQAQTTFT